MSKYRVVKHLDFRRPLIFLCGPKYTEKDEDRRYKLKKYIQSKWVFNEHQEGKISSVPIIFDNLIDLMEGKENELEIRLNLIEEIISNISYRTYIFLDTMSTSYELGQFSNFAYNRDTIRIFLEEEYNYHREQYGNNIGEYLQKSFSDLFITYEESKRENSNFIYFPKNKEGGYIIPNEIMKTLNEDSPENKKGFVVPVTFTKDYGSINKAGVIIYSLVNNKYIFDFSIKNLFYFISIIFRNTKNVSLRTMPKGINSSKFKLFMSRIKRTLFATFADLHKNIALNNILSDDFDVQIKVGNLDAKNLIYHMVYLSFLLANEMPNFTYVVSDLKAKVVCKNHLSYNDNFSIFDDKKINKAIRSKSFFDVTQCIEKKNLTIKGKNRKIICYKENNYGRFLRKLHKSILDHLLYYLPSSDNSFAYKKYCSPKQCVKKHLNNTYFVKLDIEKYFDSIKYSPVVNKITALIVEKKKYFLVSEIDNIDRGEIKRNVSRIVKEVFVDGKLPIGFVTSPKISDFYLYELDKEMSKYKKITYTRYADDILISSNDIEDLDKSVAELKKLLEKEKMTINERKVRKGNIRNLNSSFKFLGINIVNRGEERELTISNSYLINTSKMFCEASKEWNGNVSNVDLNPVFGRINYIKSISEKSYEKLIRLIKTKTCNRGLALIDKFNNCIKSNSTFALNFYLEEYLDE